MREAYVTTNMKEEVVTVATNLETGYIASMKEDAYIIVDASLREEVDDLKEDASLPLSPAARRRLCAIATILGEPVSPPT